MRRRGLAFAQRFKPRSEEKMEIRFSKDSLGILNAMFRNPGVLSGGLPSVNVSPYKAKDETGARQTARIVRWLEKHILRGGRDIPDGWQGKIEKVYVERMKEVAKHYQDIGYNTYLVNSYIGLLDELDGRSLEADDILEKGETKAT